MDKIIIKIAKILSIIVIILGVVFFILTALNGDEIEVDPALQTKILNPYGGLAFITIIITAGAIILFSLIDIIAKPKSLVRFLILVGILVVLGFIGYSLSGNNFNAEELQRLKSTAEESRMVGAALIFTYFVGALTVLALIVSNSINFFRR
ncbi:MAG: hypothetical protein KAT48_10040 [Bacteroidales bacterium]|nr:hypothetical protein [Bacteroidales bacterium]